MVSAPSLEIHLFGVGDMDPIHGDFAFNNLIVSWWKTIDRGKKVEANRIDDLVSVVEIARVK